MTMTTTLAAAFFAAVQPETGYIFGLGSTHEEAMTDAEQWSDGGTDDLVTMPCTADLADAVREDGGQVATTERDGILDVA